MNDFAKHIRSYGVKVKDVSAITYKSNSLYAFGCGQLYANKWIKAEIHFDQDQPELVTETRFFHQGDENGILGFKWFCYYYSYIVPTKYGEIFIKKD